VKLTSLATMFKKIRFQTHENIGSGPISLPEQTLHTTAYWTSLDDSAWSDLTRDEMEAGLQGMAHALRHVASLRLMCDPRDLGSVPEVRSPFTGKPTVTVYEVYPGGVGYAARLYQLHQEILRSAAELIADCPCAAGCPSCVGPLQNVEGAKEACLSMLYANASPA
jgi:DEAD/DEAH box helicase domain-containing protein